jgi:hypothetical protein
MIFHIDLIVSNVVAAVILKTSVINAATVRPFASPA